MFKLRDVGARSIDQRSILLNNTVANERPHAEMIVLCSKMLEIASGEDKSPKVLVNRLQ